MGSAFGYAVAAASEPASRCSPESPMVAMLSALLVGASMSV
jgi:hypothetical protein